MAICEDNTTKLELDFTLGTKADFLATGKFKPEWFPGAKGNNKNSMTIEGDELRSVVLDQTVEKMRIFRSEGGGGLFDVDVIYTKEESRRREQVERENFKDLAYREASEQAKGWNDNLPDSVENFKKRSARLIEQMMEIHFNEGMASGHGGYSFDKQTVHSFDNAVTSLCDILMKGNVKYSQFLRDERCRSNASEAFNRGLCLGLTGYERDTLIQRFMRETSSPAASTTEAQA